MSQNGESAVSWPRPVASAAACLEFAAPWLALLAAGFALILALLLTLQAHQAQALRDARLHITLHEIDGRLEADLALGYSLHENARAQPLLEDMLAHDAGLLGAEVFDAQGVSLFNTDRGSIGEIVPTAWLEAARAGPAARGATQPWVVSVGGDRTLGVPLSGPFGELAGYVSVTTAPVVPPTPWRLLAIAALLALVFVAAAWFVARNALRSRLAAAATEPIDATVRRLDVAQARLDRTLRRLTDEEGGVA